MPRFPVRQGRQALSIMSDPETWRALTGYHTDNGETTRQANDHAVPLLDPALYQICKIISDEEKNDTYDVVKCLWGTGRAMKLKPLLPMYDLRQGRDELMQTDAQEIRS